MLPIYIVVTPSLVSATTITLPIAAGITMASPRRPVIVEVRPQGSPSIVPASPPKAVRFPKQAEIIMGVSRPLTRTEAWSLYYFESHARTCPDCGSISSGGRLCSIGQDLAKDVNEHVYHREGQVYSTIREKSRDIRVEIPPEYDHLTALLRGMDRYRPRRQQRPAPVINYDTPLPRRASVRQPLQQAYVLPGDSRKDKSIRYSTIIVRDDDDDYDRAGPTIRTERRGSLYADSKYMQPPKEYRIEVVEPSNVRRKARRKEVYY